jgi:HK97 family phage portal protein
VAFVVSEGSVRSLERPAMPTTTRLRLADDFTQDYAEIWRTQPAVRTVVSFLARNIASLGLHAFRRISDIDRKRLTNHPLAALIAKPNPRTTRYALFNGLVHDLGIYDAAYWLKLSGPAILRVPPKMIRPTGDSWMWPDAFEMRGSKGKASIPAERVVHFHGFNPDDPRTGSSPIESLRRILSEEYEAGRMREQTLRNGARMSGYIERPAGAAWGDGARERFRTQWQSQYAGNGPFAGGTPILEDGMTFTAAGQSAKDLEYIQARKLTREEVAAAYFIPPPMVGILDNATFSNITEQHKMLYQDTLGPWLTMIAEELALQLLPDVDGTEDVYVEFNLGEKLRGSFEEQAQAASTATGRPWMTANEQRARFNLSAIDGGDDLVVPLNVLVGGQASPRDSAPTNELAGAAHVKAIGPGGVKARAGETYEEKHAEVLAAFFGRQSKVVRSLIGAGKDWWDAERWDKELAEDLWKLAIETSKSVAETVLGSIGFDPSEYDVDQTLAFLAAVAQRQATGVNITTEQAVTEALGDEDDPGKAVDHVFEVAQDSRAKQIAVTAVTAASGFAAREAAKQLVGDKATKTWDAGSNPRSSHALMNGETVPIGEKFSNGAEWPGDASLPVDERAGCNCSLRIGT